eukprot:9988574-Heterocapsa_arctica.AAC.1
MQGAVYASIREKRASAGKREQKGDPEPGNVTQKGRRLEKMRKGTTGGVVRQQQGKQGAMKS